MVVGGEVVGFVGEVAFFDTAKQADQFLQQLRAALDRQRKPNPNARTWSVRATVHLLDQTAINRYAQESKSHPYPGAAVAFLNLGAVHACKEFNIAYTQSDAPHKILPNWAVPSIDSRYCSRNVFAGADPCR
jgi:hypothetical protein